MADAKQVKTEDYYNVSSQSQTRVVLAKPRLGGFGSSSMPSSSNKSSNSFGSVLRPAQLKPSLNPFLKATSPDAAKDSKRENEGSNEDRLKEQKKEETEAPMFVPLGSANATARTSSVTQPQGATTTSNASGFVFGQNLSERVMMQDNVNNGESSSDHSSTNGSAELLFTNAAASVKENNQEEASTSEVVGETSLAAAAAEYERIHARPPPPAAMISHTGEEDEINVLQTTCRLFAWESGSWRERGRGVLRLNDAADGGGAARLVVRVAGSLRVVLNTKLWPDMVLERAGTKSLRITAADAQQQVKLFLIMGAPADISHLHRALMSRVALSKRTSAVNQCVQNTTSQKAAERLEANYPDKTDETGESDKHTVEQNNRLEPPKQKTEEYESNVDGMVEDNEPKPLKRKGPLEDETSPKRQCPKIETE